MIHPTAVVHPKAQIDPTVEIAPLAVIDEHVLIGPGCWVGPHVHLTGHTVIGENNRFHTGSVIGDAPQDLRYKNAPTRVVIGDNNVFREHVTVHRSSSPEDATVFGSGNLLMANSHVGHNCRLGDRVILANGALLGGHVQVGDAAFISGNCGVHQFVRVGTLAMMQGKSGISQDLPPFMIAVGYNRIVGLNVVGLRRAGFTSAQRLELRRLFHMLFREGRNLRQAQEEARQEYTSPTALVLLDFIKSTKRGVCRGLKRSVGSKEDGEMLM